MKNIILFISLVWATTAQAQTFTVSGKIMEVKDTQTVPIAFAEVVLLAKDSAVKNALTGNDGSFSLVAPQGDYTLLLRRFGDTLYTQPIGVAKNMDLGTIKIKTSGELQTVTITSKKPLLERKVDRLVFNISNFPLVTGGNVMDALKLTPGLTVDNTGALAIVGKNTVNVMLNGRMIQMSGDDLTNFLKSLRADDVESIEVITTPPAKYDAEGNSGLINIVMKKTQQNSWNAGLNATYQQGVYAQGAYGGNFNYQKNKLSFYASASYNRGKDYSSIIQNLYYPDLLWNMNNQNTVEHKTFSARAGFDYDITKNWTIGTEYIGSFANGTILRNSMTNLIDTSNNSAAGNILTINNNKTNINNNSGNVHSIIKLDSLGRKLNIDFDFLNYTSNSDQPYSSLTSNSLSADIPNGLQSEDEGINRQVNNYSVQIDMEHPFKKFSLDYGTKLSFSKTNNNVTAFNTSAGVPVLDTDLTNLFIYTENVQALYISGNTKFGKDNKWQAQAGLRAENTEYKGNSVTLNQINKKSYLELFPTAYLTYTPSSKNTYSISYSRRIERPMFSQLNPFRTYFNPYTYFQGNPELQPAYTSTVEFDYTYKGNLQAGVYYERVTGGNAGVMLLNDSNYMQEMTPLNYFNDYNIGGNVSYTFNKLKWWTSQNSGNFWYEKVNSLIYPLTPKSMEGYRGEFETYNAFNLNREQTISVGFDFDYISPGVSADMVQNYGRAFLNLFFKAQFLNKKLTVTLNGDNVLKAPQFTLRSERNGYFMYGTGPKNVYFRLTAAYTFGSSKLSVKKRQNSNQDIRNRVN